MSVTFRDESNESSFIMIGYSDATVTTPNYHLIVRSKTLLATVTTTMLLLWRCFVIRFYLILLISGQIVKKISEDI